MTADVAASQAPQAILQRMWAAPEFITFTGVDATTPIEAMQALSARYPIEWGILFSPKHQGVAARYPTLALVHKLAERAPGLRFAAHLCGDWSQAVVSVQHCPGFERLPRIFKRVQINSVAPDIDTRSIRTWARDLGLQAILQCRGERFPDDAAVQWLYDTSGGRGVVPTRWPRHEARDTLRGFAGGLRPENVLGVVERIDARAPYWLDMESGVRDSSDRFDLARCALVCEAIYGGRLL